MTQTTQVRRIGVHLSTTGGCYMAVNRAVEVGANCLQIFSSSPRMWRASAVKPADAAKMLALRAEHDVGPVAIHASYLINVCAQSETVRKNSVVAFRGEVERALALGAEFLVLHPGSWRGLTRCRPWRAHSCCPRARSSPGRCATCSAPNSDPAA